jgi:hypothetical protein
LGQVVNLHRGGQQSVSLESSPGNKLKDEPTLNQGEIGFTPSSMRDELDAIVEHAQSAFSGKGSSFEWHVFLCVMILHRERRSSVEWAA